MGLVASGVFETPPAGSPSGGARLSVVCWSTPHVSYRNQADHRAISLSGKPNLRGFHLWTANENTPQVSTKAAAFASSHGESKGRAARRSENEMTTSSTWPRRSARTTESRSTRPTIGSGDRSSTRGCSRYPARSSMTGCSREPSKGSFQEKVFGFIEPQRGNDVSSTSPRFGACHSTKV